MVGMVVVVECSLVGMFVGRNGRCGRNARCGRNGRCGRMLVGRNVRW